MTAADEIEAAIQRLEDQRAASTPGPWSIFEYSKHTGVAGEVAVQAHHPGRIGEGLVAGFDYEGYHSTIEPGDAHLIVTLHRTIDAQLAILKSARAQLEPFHGMVLQDAALEYELALARAINAGTAQ